MKKGIDARDREILQALENDGRATIREIAKDLDIRPSTVHERIKRLRERGVIKKFTIKVDDEMLGRNLVVFMLVAGSAERYLEEAFLKNPAVREIHGVTGEYDLLMKLKFDSMRSFNRFIISFREQYSQYISKTLTMVQTTCLKED